MRFLLSVSILAAAVAAGTGIQVCTFEDEHCKSGATCSEWSSGTCVAVPNKYRDGTSERITCYDNGSWTFESSPYAQNCSQVLYTGHGEGKLCQGYRTIDCSK